MSHSVILFDFSYCLYKGIFPLIECNEPVAGAITCLKEISEGRADFTGIDSNLGYIARQ